MSRQEDLPFSRSHNFLILKDLRILLFGLLKVKEVTCFFLSHEATPYSNGNSWLIGAPNKTSLNSCHEGSKCWVTSLYDNYRDHEQCYVMSPVFDLRGALSASKLWEKSSLIVRYFVCAFLYHGIRIRRRFHRDISQSQMELTGIFQ